MTVKKEKLWDYLILCARVLLAWILLSYGWSKVNGGQFGISAEEMARPVKDLGLFKLSWYMFDHEPFKSFIGISQIIAGLLLLTDITHNNRRQSRQNRSDFVYRNSCICR